MKNQSKRDLRALKPVEFLSAITVTIFALIGLVFVIWAVGEFLLS